MALDGPGSDLCPLMMALSYGVLRDNYGESSYKFHSYLEKCLHCQNWFLSGGQSNKAFYKCNYKCTVLFDILYNNYFRSIINIRFYANFLTLSQ